MRCGTARLGECFRGAVEFVHEVMPKVRLEVDPSEIDELVELMRDLYPGLPDGFTD